MEGSETGGAWAGTGLGREDGGEQDGGLAEKMAHGTGLGREDGCTSRTKHGGSAAPCFAEACWEVSGAALRG